MRIGFLISNLSAGGAERATSSLANYFSQHGHEVEIITFKDGDSFYTLEDKVTHLRLGFDEIALSLSLKRIFGALKRMFKIRSFIKKRKLDVLIGMSFSMTWYTVFATKFTKTKSVGTERNNPYKYKATKINSFLRKFFYKFCDGKQQYSCKNQCPLLHGYTSQSQNDIIKNTIPFTLLKSNSFATGLQKIKGMPDGIPLTVWLY